MTDTVTLRQMRSSARQLARPIDQLLHIAEGRLTVPMEGAALRRPANADWAWRPPLWSAPVPGAGLAGAETSASLAEGATVFHDATGASEVTLRQLRNTREEDMAPWGVAVEAFRFDGSFLSLVLKLPPAALRGLTRRHVFRLEIVADRDGPATLAARANVRHGPNVAQIFQTLPAERSTAAEFDMIHTDLHESRVEDGWLEIFFNGMAMNRVVLRDVTVSRRLRAEL